MQIPQIELTNEDMQEAIGQWLKKKGLELTVIGVTTKGYPIHTFIIECAEKEGAQPPLPTKIPVQGLGGKQMEPNQGWPSDTSIEAAKEFVAP